MNRPSIKRVKDKTRELLPAIAAGVVIGASVTAVVYHRKYWPKDKVAIQLPDNAMRIMREEGKGLTINSNLGWFTLNYHPNES